MSFLDLDTFTLIVSRLGVREAGLLCSSSKKMGKLVEQSGFWDELRLVKTIKKARKDKWGNVHVCVYDRSAGICVCGSCPFAWCVSRSKTPCTVPQSMPMTKSGVGKEIAKCAVEFLKDWKHAWCVSVADPLTGRFEAMHVSEECKMKAKEGAKYVYRVYVDNAGGYCVIPFWL